VALAASFVCTASNGAASTIGSCSPRWTIHRGGLCRETTSPMYNRLSFALGGRLSLNTIRSCEQRDKNVRRHLRVLRVDRVSMRSTLPERRRLDIQAIIFRAVLSRHLFCAPQSPPPLSMAAQTWSPSNEAHPRRFMSSVGEVPPPCGCQRPAHARVFPQPPTCRKVAGSLGQT
jgi:hypothetical protein